MLVDIENTYGDISHFKLGKQHIYLVNDPQCIEDILIKDYKNFIKSKGLQMSKRLLGEGLLTSEGEYHDRQRRLIQPSFHPNRIKTYGDVMISYADRLSNRWKDGDTIDIHKEMMHITSSIISKTVLGSDVADLESDKVNNALLTSMQYLNRLQMPFGDLIEKIPILPINKGFKAAKKELDSIVYNMIREHKAEEERTEQQGSSEPKQIQQQVQQHQQQQDSKTAAVSHNDLLYTLIQAQDSEEGIGRMSETQLRDEVMTIFLAGHETTANALTWTFYLLSQYPVIEQQLFEELSTVLNNNDNSNSNTEARTGINASKNGEGSSISSTDNFTTNHGSLRLPTIDDMPRLEYTEKVFRESMRIYPPAWTIGRQVIKDYTLGKYTIPSGSIVLMSQYLMHHNPKFYPNPELFYPDRWTRKFKSGLPRFAYFPFGVGIRGCVGEPFAWIEGILLLATICSRWKMHHDPQHKVEMRPLITLRPKYGMRMKLERRNQT